MKRSGILTGLGVLLLSACDAAEPPTPVADNVCDSPSLQVTLPDAVDESSGVATSRSHSGIFWTHNDSGGDAAVFALDSTGALVGRVRIRGATNRDWEDMASGPCEAGSEASCLFIAETGDNSERYGNVAVYRIPEPDPATDTVSAPVETFRFTYPDGPRDAEGLFVNDAGIHVVSKGRSGPIDLFRLPPPYQAGETLQISFVQRLAPPPTSHSAQATAAAASASGDQAVIRTYSGLRFFTVDGDTLRPRGRNADLVAVAQLQGEAVDFTADGFVLTSEATGPRPPTFALIGCDPTRPAPDSAVS